MPTPNSLTLPQLYLIRHGDTDWTDSGRHTGWTDIALNARGEQRSRQLGARLECEDIAKVFTSPLIRARRTCELAGFSLRAEVNSDLVEWNYGEYDGRTSADIQRERPDWDLFRDGAPQGESPEDVAGRADRFLKLVQDISGNVAAFSSGHVIRMLAARWLGLPPLTAKSFYTATASVSILGYERSRNNRVILLWNETLLMTPPTER